MALATVIGLIFFCFTIFQCSPVNYFWNRAQPHAHGSCISTTTLIGVAYLYSVGAAITDLTIGFLPVALIWNLHMSRRTKVAIIVILGIGCMFVTPKHLALIYLVANANIPAVRVLRLLFASPTSPPTEIQTSYVCTTHFVSPSQRPPFSTQTLQLTPRRCHLPTLYVVQRRSRNRHHGGLSNNPPTLSPLFPRWLLRSHTKLLSSAQPHRRRLPSLCTIKANIP